MKIRRGLVFCLFSIVLYSAPTNGDYVREWWWTLLKQQETRD